MNQHKRTEQAVRLQGRKHHLRQNRLLAMSRTFVLCYPTFIFATPPKTGIFAFWRKQIGTFSVRNCIISQVCFRGTFFQVAVHTPQGAGGRYIMHFFSWPGSASEGQARATLTFWCCPLSTTLLDLYENDFKRNVPYQEWPQEIILLQQKKSEILYRL